MHSIAVRLLCNQEDAAEQRVSRRRLRDSSNPLQLPEPLFQQHYRVNKAVFKYLLDTLTDALPPVRAKFGIPPVVKLSACLRFFAEGGYQKGVGRDHEIGLAQSSFSQVLSEVLEILEPLLCSQWIVWPTTEDQRKIARDFYMKYRIPGITGCIDGTHVNIISPSANKHLYYNRKGACSLNVLLVCDNQLKIRYIDATHHGASHDSFIWNTSDLRHKMVQDYIQGRNNAWLLGDAGYPLEPWLLTSYRTPEPGSTKEKFNEVHSKCRNIIERTNGVLKNRWRCLLGARELYYAPAKAVKITNVCAALHNIYIHYKSDFAGSNAANDDGSNVVQSALTGEHNSGYSRVGERIRSNIANSL